MFCLTSRVKPDPMKRTKHSFDVQATIVTSWAGFASLVRVGFGNVKNQQLAFGNKIYKKGCHIGVKITENLAKTSFSLLMQLEQRFFTNVNRLSQRIHFLVNYPL